MSSPLRLIANDLDGTLFTSHQQVSPAVRAALRRALAAGLQILRANLRDAIGELEQSAMLREAFGADVVAHYLEVIEACEKAKLEVDFYVKTFHTHQYGSAPRSGEAGSPGNERNDGAFDNSWCRDPKEVAGYMKSINKPWIAFKVMAAGAIPPRQGYTHTFSSGADFVLAGMFDWQIAEDVAIAKEVLAKVQRPYPWRA